MAVWEADRREGEGGSEGKPTTDTVSGKIGAALSSFEDWYLQTHRVPFLHLMEQEAIDLPLVEI